VAGRDAVRGAGRAARAPDLQWIQYQLDTRAGVAELLATRESSASRRRRRASTSSPATAAPCAPRSSRRRCDGGDDRRRNAVEDADNNTYADSCAFVARRGEGGGRGARRDRARSNASTGRGIVAPCRRTRRREPGLVDDAFALLDSVSQGPGSVWNIVYDPNRSSCATAPTPSRGSRRSSSPPSTSVRRRRPLPRRRRGSLGRVATSFGPYTLGANRRLLQRLAAATPCPSRRGLSTTSRASRRASTACRSVAHTPVLRPGLDSPPGAGRWGECGNEQGLCRRDRGRGGGRPHPACVRRREACCSTLPAARRVRLGGPREYRAGFPGTPTAASRRSPTCSPAASSTATASAAPA